MTTGWLQNDCDFSEHNFDVSLIIIHVFVLLFILNLMTLYVCGLA